MPIGRNANECAITRATKWRSNRKAFIISPRRRMRRKQMKLNILHEDNDIIVAVKPCGVPTQPDKTNSESMVSMLKLRIYEKENRKEEPYLVPIHRLDRPVGGVMVFAKTPEAAANLSKQSEDGSMMK